MFVPFSATLWPLEVLSFARSCLFALADRLWTADYPVMFRPDIVGDSGWKVGSRKSRSMRHLRSSYSSVVNSPTAWRHPSRF